MFLTVRVNGECGSMMPTPEIEAKEHTNYRTINVNGVFGGPRGMYFEIFVYSDELKVTKALSILNAAPEKATIQRTVECRLIIDPFQAKSLAQWLEAHVAEYEKTFGRIPSPEEVIPSQMSPGSKSENKDFQAVG